jgi:hypothetical protein
VTWERTWLALYEKRKPIQAHFHIIMAPQLNCYTTESSVICSELIRCQIVILSFQIHDQTVCCIGKVLFRSSHSRSEWKYGYNYMDYTYIGSIVLHRNVLSLFVIYSMYTVEYFLSYTGGWEEGHIYICTYVGRNRNLHVHNYIHAFPVLWHVSI